MGAKPGSLGTVRGTIRNRAALAGIFADHAIRLVGNGTTGANRDGFHLRNVNVARDLEITRFGDFRRVRAGEPDPVAAGPSSSKRGIEVGHIFKLGTKYSERIDAGLHRRQEAEAPFVMGCYGIGIGRTLQAVIEQSHDADGIIWPWPIAPFQVLVCLLDPPSPRGRRGWGPAGCGGRAGGRRRARRRPGGAARGQVQGRRPHRDSPEDHGRRTGPEGGDRRNEVARRA